MKTKRTYIDANVLIAAFHGTSQAAADALAVLGDSKRSFVISDYLRLETLPKPTYYSKADEIEFLSTFFDAASHCVPSSPEVTHQAIGLAVRYDLTPIDALHVSAAITGATEEFITLEKPTRPLLRVRELLIRSIYRG